MDHVEETRAEFKAWIAAEEEGLRKIFSPEMQQALRVFAENAFYQGYSCGLKWKTNQK